MTIKQLKKSLATYKRDRDELNRIILELERQIQRETEIAEGQITIDESLLI